MIAFAQNQRDEVRTLDVAGALAAKPGMKQQTYLAQPMAFESRYARNGRGAPSEIVPPLKAQSGETGKGDAAPLLINSMKVRRLTPVECERLQGFPDNYTKIEWYECCRIKFPLELGKYGCVNCEGEKPARLRTAADGPRYKALGNSMAVPVMRWIGERIALVDAI